MASAVDKIIGVNFGFQKKPKGGGSGKSAVDQVIGDIYGRNKKTGNGTGKPGTIGKRGGGAGGGAVRPSSNRMSRAGARDGAAVFKLIRSGGTSGKAQLRGQMKYIFNDDKLAGVIDPTGKLEMENRVEPKAINSTINDWSETWWDKTRNGNTSHMILSFPENVTIEQAELITRDVLEEILENGDRKFEYVAAIHDDKENHAHAHVIVNRRGDDNKLFNLRAGTDLSYERFRESMADHGIKYGLDLDASFRFERGITARQPSFSEQLAAQREGRKPEDRPRTDANLIYQKDLITHAKIGYEALATIAQNADCERLARGYLAAHEILENEGIITKMPKLSEEEMPRFDESMTLFNDALTAAQDKLATRDPAARVSTEIQLDEVMKDFTELSKNADYARDLHTPANSNSIYMNGAGERPDALHETKAQDVLRDIEREYGIPADALTKRLESGAPSANLEQKWIGDDLARVAAHDGMDLGTAEGVTEALARLGEAYSAARDPLAEEQAIAYLPHLDQGPYASMPVPEAYTYSNDRDGAELVEVLKYYEDNGAPAEWIRDNKPLILDALGDVNEERVAAYAATSPQDGADYAGRLVNINAPELNISDEDRRTAADFRERGVLDRPDAEVLQIIGNEIAADKPTMPHQMIDGLAETRLVTLRSANLELDLDATIAQPKPDPFEKYAARSPDGRKLVNNDIERKELVDLVREHTTGPQLAALERGDISGLDGITEDVTFARQIADVYKVEMRREGVEFTPDMQRQFADNDRALAKVFTPGVDRDHGLDL